MLLQGLPWAVPSSVNRHFCNLPFSFLATLPAALSASVFAKPLLCFEMVTVTRNYVKKQTVIQTSVVWLSKRLQVSSFPLQQAPTMQ